MAHNGSKVVLLMEQVVEILFLFQCAVELVFIELFHQVSISCGEKFFFAGDISPR